MNKRDTERYNRIKQKLSQNLVNIKNLIRWIDQGATPGGIMGVFGVSSSEVAFIIKNKEVIKFLEVI